MNTTADPLRALEVAKQHRDEKKLLELNAQRAKRGQSPLDKLPDGAVKNIVEQEDPRPMPPLLDESSAPAHKPNPYTDVMRHAANDIDD